MMIMQPKRRSQAGFTLAEMMVVLIITPLVTLFLFYLLGESSRVSRVIQELNDTQTTLQFAAGSLSRDLRRTGYMSIVTNADKRLCVTYPGQEFNSIRYTNKDSLFVSGTGYSSRLNQKIEPDAIELFGNFTTTEDFPAYIDPSNSSLLRIDFGGTEINSLAAFERAFGSPNQLVMVKGQTGQLQIIQLNITGAASGFYNVATGRATIPIRTGGSNTLGFNTTSGCGVAIRFRVAPLHKIRYRINMVSANDWRLMREVLNPGSCNSNGSCSSGNWTAYGNGTPHPPLEIAPNAVDLQFWFTTWNTVTDAPSNWDPLCTGAAVINCTGGNTVIGTHDDNLNHWPANTATVRSVFFRVSVRANNEDATLPHIPRVDTKSDLVTYELDTTKDGSARIRSAIKNVMIPNMLAR